MRLSIKLFLITCITLIVSSCNDYEDPGALQEVVKQYDQLDFDRVEAGDALHIEIHQGNFYKIEVRGDRRNVDDLMVTKQGSTLVIKFDEWDERKHTTYIDITMPSLVSANFSGAVRSIVTGFYDQQSFELYLSGATKCQLDVTTQESSFTISGASQLDANGSANELNVDISGASVLRSFDFPTKTTKANVTGASAAYLLVNERLEATASGASKIIYRGNPDLEVQAYDVSTIEHD